MKKKWNLLQIRNYYLIALLLCTINATAIDPPSSVAYKYKKNIDWGISDNFDNGSINWSKWTYVDRSGKDGTNSNYVYIPNGAKYVSIKGDAATKKGGGLATLKERYYGFYTYKFRLYGFNPNKATAWIPAIWGSFQNFGQNFKKIDPFPNKKLELDPMEVWAWDGKTTMRGQAIAWDGVWPNDWYKEARLLSGNTDFTGFWITQGLEYHPDYIRLWAHYNGSWHKMKTVWFNNKANTSTTINKAHRTKMYWILWNVIAHPENQAVDSYLHVDYFHFYPYNWSSTKSATLSSENIEDPTYITSLGSCYPNPAYGSTTTVNYQLANDGKVKLAIYDILGRLVTYAVNETQSAGDYSEVIDISSIKLPGTYILKFEADGKTFSKQIAIKR